MGIEFEPRERLAAPPGIGVCQQQIGAEPEEAARAVGLAVEDRSVEIVWRDIVGARRAEGALGGTDGRHHSFCARQVLAGDRASCHSW